MVTGSLCTFQVSLANLRLCTGKIFHVFICCCSESSSFSELARDLIMQLPYAVPLPEEGSVFDYFLDLKIYQFLPWSERKAEARKRGSNTDGGYIVLPKV